jgi:site-specific recombinase XerD
MIEQLLISDLVAQFLIARTSRNMSPRTIKLYTVELKYFCNWLGENGYPDQSINALTPVILRKWFQSLSTHRNKGGTHCNFRILKTFLRWVDFEYEPEGWKNPIKKVFIEPNRTLPLPEIPLTEVQKLLDVCNTKNGLRDKAILKFLCDTGVRGSELVAMNFEDVNLKNGTTMVQCGKGGKPRIVWLGTSGLKALNEYLETRTNLQPKQPLFLNDENERLKFFGLRMMINRLAIRAGTKKWGIHCFRRTFALTVYRKTRDIFFSFKATRSFKNRSNGTLSSFRK